jgi:Kelch motif
VWSEVEVLPDVEYGKPCARAYARSVLVEDTLYLYGGIANGFRFLSDVWSVCLSFESEPRWQCICARGPDYTKLADFSMVLFDDRLLVFGGLGPGYTFNTQLMAFELSTCGRPISYVSL